MIGKDRNDPRMPPHSGQGPEDIISSKDQAGISANFFVRPLVTDCNNIRTVFGEL
jgi:hypothetical protein